MSRRAIVTQRRDEPWAQIAMTPSDLAIQQKLKHELQADESAIKPENLAGELLGRLLGMPIALSCYLVPTAARQRPTLLGSRARSATLDSATLITGNDKHMHNLPSA